MEILFLGIHLNTAYSHFLTCLLEINFQKFDEKFQKIFPNIFCQVFEKTWILFPNFDQKIVYSIDEEKNLEHFFKNRF